MQRSRRANLSFHPGGPQYSGSIAQWPNGGRPIHWGSCWTSENHPAPFLRMARKSCSFPAYRLAVATRPSQPVGVSLSGQPGMQNAFPRRPLSGRASRHVHPQSSPVKQAYSPHTGRRWDKGERLSSTAPCQRAGFNSKPDHRDGCVRFTQPDCVLNSAAGLGGSPRFPAPL